MSLGFGQTTAGCSRSKACSQYHKVGFVKHTPEWLADIVVGTTQQAFNNGLLILTGRQHDDGDL
jgi:hypothetical protein